MISDGLHPGLHRKEYERLERDNFSQLKLMDKSAAHYHCALTTPPEDTDPKRVGRVVHLAAFEPEKFRNSVAVWDGKVRRGKDWDAFCERNEGKELLTESQYAACIDIQRSVRASPLAMRYVANGHGEAACLWTNVIGEGVNRARFECKGRFDFVAQDAIVDLKTTRDARGPEFARQVVGLHYDAQAAWYSDGHALATGRRKPYVIVAVETAPPFDVVVYRVPEIVIDLGREKYTRWLERLAWCRERNSWPGYAGDMELELELPAWALPKDDDIGALDLDLGAAAEG